MSELLFENIDYFLFSAFVLAVGIGLHCWARSRCPRQATALGKVLFWSVLIGILGGGWKGVATLGDWEAARIRKMLEGIAPTYARELELLGHAKLTEASPPEDPAYLRMIEAQKRWLGLHPGVADIYTLRKLPSGTNVFIVDSETDYDHNGKFEGSREQRTVLGEPYPEQDEGLELAFRGVANFETKPVTDRWGTWVSAFVPMLDDAGRVEAVLGVDYDAREWRRAVASSRAAGIAYLTVILIFFQAFVLIVLLLKRDLDERKASAEAVERAKAATEAANQQFALANLKLQDAIDHAEQMARAAQSASRAKSDFLAAMSREIRTPLNGILGMTSLLLESPLRPDQRELAETARSSGESLLGMLSDVLDAAKLEAGKLTLHATEFDPRWALEQTVELFASLANAKDLELVVHVETGVPPRVRGDFGRLRQIFLNLVGNALKFTGHGTVAIRASVAKRSGLDVTLLFEVSDTGIGIEPEMMPKIFETFGGAEDPERRQGVGWGLGLALSKQLIELMGGEIGVESHPDRGSRFWFKLPLQMVLSEEPVQAHPRLAGRRVLLVEPHEAGRESLYQLLTEWEIRVDAARTLDEAVAKLQGADGAEIEAVLLSGSVAGSSLDAGIRSLRERSGNQGLFIVVLTRATPSTFEEDGKTRCLLKPVVHSRLKEILLRRWSSTAKEKVVTAPRELQAKP